MEEQVRGLASTGQSCVNDLLNTMQSETDSDSEISNVTEFLNGQNVLITGASGFLGKLLVEKLLRSCPKMGKLYMLMRAKKGKTPDERFKEHFTDALYNRLKGEMPNYEKKVVLIEGDTSSSDLSISDIDRVKLKNNVNIIFHAAATVRFDETVRQAVTINVRGTKLLLQFAKEMKNLKAFVHVSTAFSNCILKNIEEKFYDPPMDPDKVLSLVQMLDDDMLEHMKSKLLGKWPNTYAFSKALGEEIIRIYGDGMPVTIVRPSIVIATYKEPIPGWINNYYGPTGVVMGAGIGLLRTLHCESTKIADIIPADYVVNEIIVSAWNVAQQFETKQKEIKEKGEELEKKEDPVVFNSVSSCQKPINWGEFMYMNEMHGKKVPSALVLWHYVFMLNKHLWVHNLFCFLLHTIPGAIVDTLALIAGREPVLLKAYKKIHKFSGVISYFATQEWTFDNKNTLALWNRISPADKKKFYFHLESLDWDDYFYYHVRGLRQYILKDPLDTIDIGRVKYRRLKFAHYTITAIVFTLLTWGLYSLLKILVNSKLSFIS